MFGDRFIRLIRKFLNAGCIEDWIFFKTYSGTPQGGIISPILANIYLDKFDKYLEEYIQSFDIGKQSKNGVEEKSRLTKRLKIEEDESERKALIKRIRAMEQKYKYVSRGDEMDIGYKRLKYVRYADDFLIGVIGSKEDN